MAIYNREKKTAFSLEKTTPESPSLQVNAGKNEKEEMCNETKNTDEDCVQDCPSKASNGQEQTLESLYKYVLIFSSTVGLHLVRRDHDGTFITYRWAVVSFVVLTLICFMSIPPVAILMFRSTHFWYKVILLPYVYGLFFCVYSYIQVAVYRHDFVHFLEAAANLKVSSFGSLYRLVAWTFFFPMMIVSCSLVFILGEQQFLFAPSVVVLTIVPAVLDVYMGSLVKILQRALLKLIEEVETHEVWTLKDAQRVMSDWYHVAELLNMFNKMFSGRVHMRLMGLLVNSLSYMFIFWAMEQFRGDCAKMVVVTVLPLWEVLVRFYQLCSLGQSVICAGEDLLAAVREAAYEAGLGTRPFEILSELATRLESSPLAIKNWGMESLSARTYVKLSGVMMTYLVVLLQFCEQSTYTYTKTKHDPITSYDHCFLSPNSTWP